MPVPGGGGVAEGGAGNKRCGALNSAPLPAAGHWPLQSPPLAFRVLVQKGSLVTARKLGYVAIAGLGGGRAVRGDLSVELSQALSVRLFQLLGNNFNFYQGG